MDTLLYYKKHLITTLLITASILTIGGFFFIKSTAKPAPAKKDLPIPSVQPTLPPQVKGLINTVGKKIDLPPDEIPNVATVSDVNKLKDQAFFAKAKKGDKVLIYILSKKAILYRPTTGQIIQESSLEIASDTTASESAVLSETDSTQASSSPVLKIKF